MGNGDMPSRRTREVLTGWDLGCVGAGGGQEGCVFLDNETIPWVGESIPTMQDNTKHMHG